MSMEQWAVVLFLSALLTLLGLGRLRRSPSTAGVTETPPHGPDMNILEQDTPFPHRPVPPPVGSPAPVAVTLGSPRRVRLEPSRLRPGPGNGPVARKGRPLTLPTRSEPLWQEKGWRRTGNGVEGHYHSGNHTWRGLVQEPYPGRYQAFIWGPPVNEIGRNTPHGACFQNKQRDGRYQIHYHTAPRSLDHAICSIEDVLGEALGAASRR